ncbi:MAG: TetR/AcrR family transcriptional regulator [Glaciecola sp.]
MESSKQPQRGVVKRAENKAKRLATIIQHASELVAKNGANTFTLLALAKQANVTVPTIHNLVGKKSDVFSAIVSTMETKTSAVLMHLNLTDPISVIEDLVDGLITLYSGNESLYKAAFAIGESEQLFEHEIPTALYDKSLAIAHSVCKNAAHTGLLLGNINADLMAKLLFANQRLVRRDWMHGYISLATYKRELLSAIYVTLAADASTQLHAVLIAKIKTLQTNY